MSAIAIEDIGGRPQVSARHAVIVIIAGVVATTLGQPEVLGRLPLQNLLKNELHVSRAANAAFFFWIGLPWYFKPLAGVLTDAFPLFGRRRAGYMVSASVLAAIGWAGIGLTAHRYGPLLWAILALNVAMVMASTTVGAFMVERAQEVSQSGRFTAIRTSVMWACVLVSGLGGGYLASIAFGWTALACGAVVFALAPAAILFLDEPRSNVRADQVLARAGAQLRGIISARDLSAAVGLMALVYLAPGLFTALFYRQQNDLHMTTQDQGVLRLFAGAGGIVASLVYGWLCRRVALRRLLVGGISTSAVLALGYLFYNSIPAARLIAGFEAFGLGIAEVALLDLALRATPFGSEGLGYAVVVSVTNIVTFGSDWVGSAMMDLWHWPFWGLVLANAGATLLAAPLALLLPAAVVARRDGEAGR